MKKIICIFALAIFLFSCGNYDTSRLEAQIKSDLKEFFDEEARNEGISYSIKSFGLVHKGGNVYSGILETIEDGEHFSYTIEAIYDGRNYKWEIID